jgi:hypothetical protein
MLNIALCAGSGEGDVLVRKWSLPLLQRFLDITDGTNPNLLHDRGPLTPIQEHVCCQYRRRALQLGLRRWAEARI